MSQTTGRLAHPDRGRDGHADAGDRRGGYPPSRAGDHSRRQCRVRGRQRLVERVSRGVALRSGRRADLGLEQYLDLEDLATTKFELFIGNPEITGLLDAVDAACAPDSLPLPPCGTGAYPCDPGNANIFDIPVPVDPSGFVMTRTGIPLERARVVLQRSDTKTGPFSPLPDGSLEMSASNRRNPDFTDLNGHFGWDVFPGFYRVAATHRGCRGTVLSPSSPVPPPVTDLRLRLNCPGLHRARTLTRILSAKLRGPETILALRVARTGRRGSRPPA